MNSKDLTTKPAQAQAMELSEIEKELALEAKDEKSRETLGTPRIQHKGGRITIDGNEVPNNKLALIVVDYTNSKEFYPGEYDPKAHETPTCYAFGKVESEMVPHKAAPDKQSPQCEGCPHNKFGTAERGNGKRCKDTRRLMVIMGDGDLTEVRQISIPPGSLRNWGAYLSGLKDVTPSGNVRTVVTEVGTQAGKVGAHELTFRFVKRLEPELIQAVHAKRAGVQDGLNAPFPNIEKEEREPVKANPKRARKIE